MPGHKPRTNKGLAIAAVLMCLACGVSFTQSSASHSPITDTQIPDMFVAGNTDDSQIQSGGAAAKNTDAEEENTPEDVIPTETPAADTPAPFITLALTVHNRVNRRRQMIVPIRILYST